MSAPFCSLQALGDELRMLVVRHRLSEELTSLMDGYVTLLQRISKTRRPGKKTPVEIELASWQLQRASWVPQVSIGYMEAQCSAWTQDGVGVYKR